MTTHFSNTIDVGGAYTLAGQNLISSIITPLINSSITNSLTTYSSTLATSITSNSVSVGFSGSAGTFKVFPSTPAKGDFKLTCANQTGNTEVVLNIASMGQATTITLPDPGSSTATLAYSTGLISSPRLILAGGSSPDMNSGFDGPPDNTTTDITEIYIPQGCIITGIGILNGSVVAGNVHVGLANSSGAIVAQSASTAMSGSQVYQRVPFTAPYTATGQSTYYVVFQASSNTARFVYFNSGNFGASRQTGQTYGTFTTITPPTIYSGQGRGNVASLY